MSQVRGRRVLVTGASGLMALPMVTELARENEVFAAARFTDASRISDVERAGARAVRWDAASPDWGELPDAVDYVFHIAGIKAAAAESDPKLTFETNVQAAGRLMSRYRSARGFLYCGSGSAYRYIPGERMSESTPFGLHNGLETYAASKIAAESVVEFASKEFGLPAVIIRIFSAYGPLGGAITSRIGAVRSGEPVPVYPGAANRYNPLFESDYVEKAIAAIQLAATPPLVVNFAGSESSTIEEYCRIAARILGVEVTFREDPAAYWPLWADVTKMERLLGPTRVSVKEGIRRVIAARYPEAVTPR